MKTLNCTDAKPLTFRKKLVYTAEHKTIYLRIPNSISALILQLGYKEKFTWILKILQDLVNPLRLIVCGMDFLVHDIIDHDDNLLNQG